MTDFAYDIESYPNVFTLTTKEVGVDRWWVFEISDHHNDQQQLVQFIMWLASIKARMCGYNNYGYDYPVLHYILKHPGLTAHQIYQFSMSIINADHDDRFRHIVWDNDQIVPQLDLYKIHHFDNVARATSLKAIEFNMRMDSVQDLPFPPGTVLTNQQIETLITYNKHDVFSTELFYFETTKQIAFREELSTKYNRNFLNHNDTKIGKDYFIMELGKAVPGACYTKNQSGKRVPRQTWRDQIVLRDIIFSWINFKRPEFIAVKEWFESQIIRQTKGVFTDIPTNKLGDLAQYANIKKTRNCPDGKAKTLNTVVNGFQFDFGTGGIHGSVSNRIFETNETYEIVDIDVASFYPNLAIVNQLYPEHLGSLFCSIYKDVYDQRKTYKKGTVENAMLKLALNGVYGDSNNMYSPFYDPAYTMSITINGQLLICLLADYLMDIPGLQMIQVNTDGVTVYIPKTRRDDLTRICEWWQTHTCLELEEAIYSRMWIRDVNNYLAEYAGDGKLKHKGAFAWDDLEWHRDHSALIIPMAAEAALVEGIPPRWFILNHDDIFDFMLRAKIPRSSRLVIRHNGVDTPQQNLTRYYVSQTGGSMVKIMPPLAGKQNEREIGICVGWNTTECNDITTADGLNINYEYYIQEAEKLIKPLI